ncbi:hypothetical protein pipiens_018420 [Culex pipiens pipiens]|uniref:Uncharacterized protein n=1 Tax=Culex pipiens pipiens TaxID=38569 RepID=A0ABD1CBS9_CULPP
MKTSHFRPSYDDYSGRQPPPALTSAERHYEQQFGESRDHHLNHRLTTGRLGEGYPVPKLGEICALSSPPSSSSSAQFLEERKQQQQQLARVVSYQDLQYSGGQTSPTGRHQLSTASSYGQQQIKLESLSSPTRAFRLEPADEVELPPPPPPAVVRSSAVVPDGGRHPSVIYETSSSSRYDGGLSSLRQNQQQHHPEQQLPNNGNLQQQEIEYLQKGAASAVTAAKRKRDTAEFMPVESRQCPAKHTS